MSDLSNLAELRADVESGRKPLRITTHAQGEASKDGIFLADLRAVFESGEVIESYADENRWLLYGRGGEMEQPIHVVVEATEEEGVIVTAYVPDRSVWLADKKRKQSRGKSQ